MAGGTPSLLLDMAVILAVAGATTLIFVRLRQPTAVGYLLAGLIVGPHTPPFSLVRDEETIRLLGELGVIFLLFALGLEFNLRKLRKVGATALVSGTLQVAIMIWLGYLVGRAFGLEPPGAIFLGAIVSISSTVIIVKVVGELRQQDEEWAQIVIGILIVEDILAVLMLTLLSAAGSAAELTPLSVGLLLGEFSLFILGALVLGLLVVPRFVTYVSALGLPDVLVVTSIALGFGLAILGGVLGFSPALGAFLMGALIAESPAHHRVAERIAPIRDLFTAIFFVTVGMLVDPRALVEHAHLILAVTAAIILGKILAGSFATFVTGRDPTTSLRVGFGLAQVGEFSFILAALALAVGATDAPLYVVSVSAAGITAFTTPYLIRAAPRVATFLDRVAPRPLRTYATLYATWTRRLYESGAKDACRKQTVHAGVRTLLFGAASIAILVGGGASVRLVGGAVANRLAMEPFHGLLGWITVGLAALPFILLYARSQADFARRLADASIPEAISRRADASTIRTVLFRSFLLVGYVLAASLLLLFASPFLPTLPVLVPVAAGIALAGLLLYRSISRIQGQVDVALAGIFGDDAAGPDVARQRHREVLEVLREEHPFPGSVREVRFPDTHAATSMSIRKLHLRAQTGATILAIHRGDGQILHPPPESLLLPGDRLVLMGSEDQIRAAALLLVSLPPVSPAASSPAIGEVAVAPGSAIEGRSLASLALPARIGVTVLEIRRANEPVGSPPPPSTVLRGGDVLVLVGSEEQLEKVRALAIDPASTHA